LQEEDFDEIPIIDNNPEEMKKRGLDIKEFSRKKDKKKILKPENENPYSDDD